MYDNIGGKIKGLSMAIAVIEAASSAIIGFIMMVTDEDLVLIGLIIVPIGCLVAWISSWLLYGFGELIEATRSIATVVNRNLNDSLKISEEKMDSVRLARLQSLLSSNLLTEKEYKEIIERESQIQ